MASTPQTLLINHQPVELFRILKFEGLASSGGEAKHLIAEGLVAVNGERETRKRRKMMAGDLIDFNGLQYRLALQSSVEVPPEA